MLQKMGNAVPDASETFLLNTEFELGEFGNRRMKLYHHLHPPRFVN